MPNKPVVVETGEEVVARARSQIGIGTQYLLGAGGRIPAVPYARAASGGCDCSGFVAWCLGVDRYTPDPWYRKLNGGWIETSAIVRDLATPFGIFDGWPIQTARPGMLYVWPDRYELVEGRRRKMGEGHVGVISEVDEHGPTHVIHCSKGNYTATKDAIRETAALIFRQHSALVAKVAWIDEEGSA